MAHPPRSLTQDYVFRVYESSSSQKLYPMEAAMCPVVMMVSHEGFQWNDELFVSPYRRCHGVGTTRTLKSSDRIQREDKVASTTSCIHHPAPSSRHNQQQQSDDDVIDIQLTESECNIWP
ncbi:hypothetical protein O0I10_009615 [Lichtheimia ornata]|uniref:Uncharacterized protein n=1 Tax=Lichtheimia ornata TaxID=688661 RepID=A0AAD7XS18_9FUNG|nr:uncharacterized protein O0I10_009615 [Lichtheimia ornata]KAJ8654724.1 hypothetical protein O0I10_009615 [Lichtheimia ornata]